MIGYELKKLARRPVFLLVLLCVLGFKTAYTLSGIAEIRPEAEYVRLVKEYSAYTLDEAERRIKIDAAEAEEQFFRDYESEYNEGKLTIEEFREFQREYSARAARYSATQNVLAQVERLTSHENGDSGAAGLGIRVIDETGWLLAGRLSTIWLCPLILVFVAVAILCEWHDDEMYDLLRTTSNGVRRSMRVKMSLCLGIMLVVSLIDASGTYLIPRLLYGLDCPDAAVQSVSLYAKLADCLPSGRMRSGLFSRESRRTWRSASPGQAWRWSQRNPTEPPEYCSRWRCWSYLSDSTGDTAPCKACEKPLVLVGRSRFVHIKNRDITAF